MKEGKLDPKEIARYSRQIVLDNWGLEKQKKLKSSTVTIVGLGGLGTTVAGELAKAGIGKLRLIDPDVVEEANLSAQFLHWDNDIGKPKVLSVKEKIEKMNPYIEVVAIRETLTENNAHRLLKESDVVVDATDNLTARGIINKTCVELNIPFVHAGVRGFRGQIMTVKPGEGPCLACLYGELKGRSLHCPVVGPAVAVLSSLEALEVIKLITGLGEPLVGRLLIFDGLFGEFDIVPVERRGDCPICGIKEG
ncbi:MAG: HesA/MoeB/ThiF family protein [Candidatus Njordarchaeia archaeon]